MANVIRIKRRVSGAAGAPGALKSAELAYNMADYNLAAYHAKQYTYKTAARRAKANLGVAQATLTAQMRPLE